MQLVSDLQQRPNKGRLKMEKTIVSFYDLCTLVQIVTFIVHTVQTKISAARTFRKNFFLTSSFELAPTIAYKTSNCTFNTTRNIYAFNQVQMTFNASSVNDVFVDQAIQMRLGIFIMAVSVFLGAINRVFVENNFFSLKFRNFIFYKDLLSATELLLISYVLQISIAAHPPAALLRDYLTYCGIVNHIFLPYINTVSMYVFAAVGYFSYLVGLCLYLWNSMPKYGVMTPAEIEEYKTWLRQRKSEMEQSKVFIEQAKRLHAQMQMMQTEEFTTGRANDGLRGLMPNLRQVSDYPPTSMPSNYASTAFQPPAYPPGAYSPAGYPPPPPNYPYPPSALPPGMVYPPINPSMPPPQVFGAGAPSAYFPPGYVPPGYMPPGYPQTSYVQSSVAQPPSLNMPRRRNVPNT